MPDYSDIDMTEVDIDAEVTQLADALEAGDAEIIDQQDTDDDGLVDVITIDENGDGIVDVVVVDTDGDDVANELHYDTNSDGLTDIAAADTDGDGAVETVYESPENDTDDTYDVMLLDTDGDGSVDEVYNYDAASDTYLLDNGAPEPTTEDDGPLDSAESF